MLEEFKEKLLQKLKKRKEEIIKQADKQAKLSSIASFKRPSTLVGMSIIISIIAGCIFLITGTYAPLSFKYSFEAIRIISAVLGVLTGTSLTILLAKAKNNPDLVLDEKAKTPRDFLKLETHHEIRAMINYAKADVIKLIEDELTSNNISTDSNTKSNDEIKKQILEVAQELTALKKRQKELIVKYVLIGKFKKMLKKERRGNFSSDVSSESISNKEQIYFELRGEYPEIDLKDKNLNRRKILLKVDEITKTIAKLMLRLKTLEYEYHQQNKSGNQKTTQIVEKFRRKKKSIAPCIVTPTITEVKRKIKRPTSDKYYLVS